MREIPQMTVVSLASKSYLRFFFLRSQQATSIKYLRSQISYPLQRQIIRSKIRIEILAEKSCPKTRKVCLEEIFLYNTAICITLLRLKIMKYPSRLDID